MIQNSDGSHTGTWQLNWSSVEQGEKRLDENDTDSRSVEAVALSLSLSLSLSLCLPFPKF